MKSRNGKNTNDKSRIISALETRMLVLSLENSLQTWTMVRASLCSISLCSWVTEHWERLLSWFPSPPFLTCGVGEKWLFNFTVIYSVQFAREATNTGNQEVPKYVYLHSHIYMHQKNHLLHMFPFLNSSRFLLVPSFGDMLHDRSVFVPTVGSFQ